jgi:hypothetical protein
MGTDIKVFVEQKYKKGNSWETIATIHLRRDYILFGYLAGVRSDIIPLYSPRGYPNDIAWRTEHAALWHVCSVDDDNSITIISAQKANHYVERGISQWYKYGDTIIDPDAHHASWLFTNELEKAITKYEGKRSRIFSILGMMKDIESRTNAICRVVFWFN